MLKDENSLIGGAICRSAVCGAVQTNQQHVVERLLEEVCQERICLYMRVGSFVQQANGVLIYRSCTQPTVAATSVDPRGRPVIHLAIDNDAKDMVSFLMSKGAGPGDMDAKNITAYELAARMKKGALLALMTELTKDINQRDGKVRGETLLQ